MNRDPYRYFWIAFMILGFGLVLIGCEVDDTPVNNHASQLKRVPSKQIELNCPERSEDFCGGWIVKDSTIEHLAPGDQFVIAERFLSRLPLNGRVPGFNLKRASFGNCLWGEVTLEHGETSQRHYMTVTREDYVFDPGTDIGKEIRLHIELTPLEMSAEPPFPGRCVQYPDNAVASGVNFHHGGVAHGQD